MNPTTMGIQADQLALFVDSLEEALRATIMGLGGLKSVGVMLRPSMSADEAGRWLSDCLNNRKREKLGIGELATIRREARKKGVHILATYEARDAGYRDPEPLVLEAEKAELDRKLVAAVESLSKLQAEFARLSRLQAVT